MTVSAQPTAPRSAVFVFSRVPTATWLALLVLAGNLYALLVPTNSLMNWFSSDDAFYYFKTAQNAAEGYGLTFDRLGRDSGFHPLWMIICIPVFWLARFDLIFPLRIIVMISMLLSAGSAVLIYQMARHVLHPAAAVFAAVFFAFFPSIHAEVVEMGMEAGISAFFIILLLYRVIGHITGPQLSSRQIAFTGLIAALTILARLDNIFLVFVFSIWVIFQTNRQRYLLAADACLITLGVLWSFFVRVGFGPQYAVSGESSYWMAAAALAFRISMYYLFGLYRRPAGDLRGLIETLLRAGLASGTASILISGTMLGLFALQMFPGFPRLTLAYEAGFGLGALLLTRLVSWLAARRSSPGEDDSWNWAGILKRAVLFYAPVGVLMAVYLGMNLAYFGTPSPVSGQIKRWWGTLPNVIYGRPVSNTMELLGFFAQTSPWKAVQALTAWPGAIAEGTRLAFYGLLVGGLTVWQRKRIAANIHMLALIPLFAGGFIQIISYTGTGYLHMRGWYWVGQMLLITLLLAVLVDAIVVIRHPDTVRSQPASFMNRHSWANLFAAVLSILVLIAGMTRLVRNLPATVATEKAQRYLLGIYELEAHTEPGAIIGSTGGGVIAYFVKDRTIVNLDGLMNTHAYFQALQGGTAAEYLDQMGLDYIYSNEYPITSSDPYFQFKGRLRKIKDFGGATLFDWQSP